jgi:hypothetical protein
MTLTKLNISCHQCPESFATRNDRGCRRLRRDDQRVERPLIPAGSRPTTKYSEAPADRRIGVELHLGWAAEPWGRRNRHDGRFSGSRPPG